jgi:hypothetical protein
MAPGWSMRPWPLRTIPAAAAAAVLAAELWWPAVPPRLHVQEPDPVVVARAFDAAWNAHDLQAVLACFAPDAVVRERRGEVPPAVWDTRDPRVVRDFLEDSHDGDAYDTGGLSWAMGHRQIAVWAAARFAQHHRFESARRRVASDPVGWRYREFVDPFQRLPGVGPIEGIAEAVVRGGRITRLTLVQSPASVQRQRAEVAATFDRAMATQQSSPLPDGPSVRPRGSRSEGPAAEPTDSAWPLALSALAVLALATAALRRRRAPRGEWDGEIAGWSAACSRLRWCSWWSWRSSALERSAHRSRPSPASPGVRHCSGRP